jgi:uncharacterized protein (DUF2147 family)
MRRTLPLAYRSPWITLTSEEAGSEARTGVRDRGHAIREEQMRFLVPTVALFAAFGTPAGAAESIVGNWLTASGHIAQIRQCDGGYCIIATAPAHRGKQIGRMSGSDGSYSGEITDPETDRTYSGSATVTGSSLKLTGCALKVFCRSQTWTKR